jgi:hypothetical protein
MSVDQEVARILADPGASEWLKSALRTGWKLPPRALLIDINTLANLVSQRIDEQGKK